MSHTRFGLSLPHQTPHLSLSLLPSLQPTKKNTMASLSTRAATSRVGTKVRDKWVVWADVGDRAGAGAACARGGGEKGARREAWVPHLNASNVCD